MDLVYSSPSGSPNSKSNVNAGGRGSGSAEGLSDVVMNANAANNVFMDDLMKDLEDQGQGEGAETAHGSAL